MAVQYFPLQKSTPGTFTRDMHGARFRRSWYRASRTPTFMAYGNSELLRPYELFFWGWGSVFKNTKKILGDCLGMAPKSPCTYMCCIFFVFSGPVHRGGGIRVYRGIFFPFATLCLEGLLSSIPAKRKRNTCSTPPEECTPVRKSYSVPAIRLPFVPAMHFDKIPGVGGSGICFAPSLCILASA